MLSKLLVLSVLYKYKATIKELTLLFVAIMHMVVKFGNNDQKKIQTKFFTAFGFYGISLMK